MLTKSKKFKGKSLQNYVRDQLCKLFNFDKLNVKSTTMGDSGVDVQLGRLELAQFPFAIECKKYAKFSVYSHYQQAQSHATKLSKETGLRIDPLLIIEANYKRPLAVLDAEVFFALVHIAMHAEQYIGSSDEKKES